VRADSEKKPERRKKTNRSRRALIDPGRECRRDLAPALWQTSSTFFRDALEITARAGKA